MDNIKHFYEEYKLATESILAALRDDDFNRMDILLDQRERLLQSIECQNLNKEMLSDEAALNSIQELEYNIIKILEDKKADITRMLGNVAKSRKANSLYYNTSSVGSIVFNKKI